MMEYVEHNIAWGKYISMQEMSLYMRQDIGVVQSHSTKELPEYDTSSSNCANFLMRIFLPLELRLNVVPHLG